MLPQIDQPHPCPTLFVGLVKVRYKQYFCTTNSIEHLRQSTFFFQENSGMVSSKCSAASYFSNHPGKSI